MLNMWRVRELTEKVTNMVMNYTEVEAKVREATNDEAWGPTGPQMQELAQSTFYYEQFPEVMGMLWKRMLQDNRAAWRRTYKSLLLLNYLVRNGSERVVTSAREHIYDLRTLENYKFIDEHGKDQGMNIRVKAKDLIDFIQDDNRLREERKKAKKNKDKYVGVSSESMGFRSSSQSDWDGWGNSRRKEEDDFGSRFEDSPNASEEEIEDAVDPVNEYRDEETSPKTGGKTSLGGGSGIGSRGNSAPVKKSSKPSKMVDLGAAATFGRDGSSTQSPQTTPSKTKAQNNDLLDNLFGSQASNGTSSPSKTSPTSAEDDFDPRAGEAGVEKQDFGDFNSAFGNAAAPANGNTDFADFSNFSQTAPEPPGGSSNASLLMGISAPTPAAAPASSATSPVAPAAPAPHSSNMDLLDDLLGSATTSPSSSSVVAVPPSTPSVASSDLLGGLGGGLGGALTPTPAATSPIMPVSTMPASRPPQNEPGDQNRDELATKPETEGVNNTPEQAEARSQLILARLKALSNGLQEEISKRSPDQERVLSLLENVSDHLTGPCTPQKYAGIDQLSHEGWLFRQHFYGPVVSMLLNNITADGFLRKHKEYHDIVWNLIKAGYFEENLNILLCIISNAELKSAKLAVSVLEDLLLSSCFLDCLLRRCSEPLGKVENDSMWDETVRLLVSLPERTANKLQKDTPERLMPSSFCKIVALQILQALICLADGLNHEISGTVEPVAKLLGQLCYVSDTQSVLLPIMHWLGVWVKKNPIIQRVSFKMFAKLPSLTSERVLTALLKMDMNSKELFSVIGDCGVTNAKMKYLLTQKFLITRHLPCTQSVPTIVNYLALADPTNELLKASFCHLLEVWCDKSIMTHSSFEHHTFITKGLMACLSHFNPEDVEACKHETIQKLLHGMANHLDNPSQEMKVLGMVVGEELTKVLHSGGPSLKFEYEDDDLTFELKALACKEGEESCLEVAPSGCDSNGTSLFEDFEAELYIIGILKKGSHERLESKNVCRDSHLQKSKEDTKNCLVKLIMEDHSKNTEAKAELDSDDDEFEPYDMSNDTCQSKVKEPAYAQEVLEYIIDGEVDKVEAALRVCERIVQQDMKEQDSELAVEMTKVLLHLDNKYNLEDFDVSRTRSLCALTASHPRECAFYLGGEFFERNYTMKQRKDILHTLGQAAIELSGESPQSNSLKSCQLRRALQPNVMKEAAGFFFFPLVRGVTESRPHLDLLDADRHLLCDLLRTLGLFVRVTGQSEITTKMAGCLLELTWSLRVQNDPEIRGACLEGLSSALEAVPDTVLLSLVPGEMMELRQWLAVTLQQDRDRRCQLLAAKLALRLDRCFADMIGLPKSS
ncbi:telomere length regulation protein TEL2 homolog isoform X1 [Penaeus vannamei]|uniref:telomere length regulation protein TEL2 homolog isoform X1 n=1 Tax=Penaeus vannamei TaxID=6689 RepID=UPI00387FA16A